MEKDNSIHRLNASYRLVAKSLEEEQEKRSSTQDIAVVGAVEMWAKA